MGFSVSGSAAIVFAGVLVSFGIWYGAAANSFERVTEAQDDRSERSLETANTDVAIVTASYDGTAEDLTVEANNTGVRTLSLNATDLLIDNEYETGWRANASVADDDGTWIWQSGEQLSVTVSRSSAPGRVKIVTEHGVANATGVS